MEALAPTPTRRTRVFYGWWIALSTSLLSFVAVGIGFYSHPVFLSALPAERGWSPIGTAGATAVYFAVSGLVGPGVGWAVDRFGSRAVIAVGASLMALSLVWIGVMTRPIELYFAYPLMALGFTMSGAIPSNALITRWFVRRRALAMTISQTGVSIGGIVLVPLTAWVIQEGGIELATRMLALLLIGIAFPVAGLVLRASPDQLGVHPDGAPAPPADDTHAGQQRVWELREFLGTRAFWGVTLTFAIALFVQTGVMVHLVAFAGQFADTGAAAFAISLMAGGSIAGRFAVGAVADRVDKRRLTIGVLAWQAVMLVGLAFCSSLTQVYVASFLFGLTVGNVYMLMSLLVGDLFGIPSFGRVYGSCALVTQACSGAGPYVLALATAASSYTLAFGLAAASLVVSMLLLTRLRPPPCAPRVESAA